MPSFLAGWYCVGGWFGQFVWNSQKSCWQISCREHARYKIRPSKRLELYFVLIVRHRPFSCSPLHHQPAPRSCLDIWVSSCSMFDSPGLSPDRAQEPNKHKLAEEPSGECKAHKGGISPADGKGKAKGFNEASLEHQRRLILLYGYSLSAYKCFGELSG